MDAYAIISTVVVFVPLIIILAAFGYSRGRYKNISNAGAFFFEDGCLVLNTGAPYAIPIEKIDHVELRYSAGELESRLSYNMTVKVVRRDGSAKSCFYKGYRTAKLALPADMAAAVEAHGLPCVMVDR